MAKIEIYTKAFCPYCSRAKALLARTTATRQAAKSGPSTAGTGTPGTTGRGTTGA